MNKTITIFLVVAFCVGCYFAMQGFLIAQERVDRFQCQEWEKDLEEIPGFYLVEWQKKMCEESREL